MSSSKICSFSFAIRRIMTLELQVMYILIGICVLLHIVQGTQSLEEQTQNTLQEYPTYETSEYSFNNPRFQNEFIKRRAGSFPRRYSSLLEAGEQLGRPALRLISTDNRKLPWTCDCTVYWRDLGDGFHPRFVRDARCSTTTCYHGHYSCMPRKHFIPVLKRVDNTDDLDSSDTIFENEFYFVNISVTTSCYCGG